MGQISLPRLEKINTTMFWESTLLYNNERWLSIKSFIFLKILLQYIFKNNYFRFKTKWILNKNKITSQFVYKKIYFKYENNSKVNSNLFFNHYIYQLNNKYILAVIYID